MWIFGQVWFACLVGFGAGVLLDWLWRVRPLRRRVDELEREVPVVSGRTPMPAPYQPAEPTDPGYLDSGYPDRGDRGYPTSYPPPRPAAGGVTLAELLDRGPEPDPEPEPAAEATRIVPRVEEPPPSQPLPSQPLPSQPLPNQPLPSQPPAAPAPAPPPNSEPTRYVAQSAPISFDGSTEADRQYLEYLRSGGAGQTPGAESERQRDPAPTDERPATPTDESATESTTILPAIDGSTSVFPPAASGDDLPQRVGGDRHTEHIPFLDSQEQESQGEAQSGQLTPIGEHGFQPFEKPLDPDEFARHDLWVGENGQLIGVAPDEPGAPAGSEDRRDSRENRDGRESAAEERAWFAEASTAPQQMPAAWEENRRDNHRDGRHDGQQESRREGRADSMATETRSLFEPVIEAEHSQQQGQQQNRTGPARRQPFPPRPIRVRTGVNGSAPGSGHGGAHHRAGHAGGPGNGPGNGPNGAPVPPPPPARAPAGSGGYQIGPFGPGSALPMPDGSAPSPQFRVKARTSSMVFHTEESPFYERLEPQVWFRSAEDAKRAGFTSWERPHSY